MIQRIQTIWLLLACLILILLIFIPLAGTSNGQYQVMISGVYQNMANKSTKVQATLPLLVFNIAVALLAFINIFNFKNRSLQKRFAYINILFILGLGILAFYATKNMPGQADMTVFKAGLFMPVPAIVCCLLAVRGISADEKLIKSADRLR